MRGRASRGTEAGAVVALVFALGPVAGCNFQIPDETYITTTKLLSVHGQITELGPLNPDRVGVSDKPIAEPMPGDRYTFEMVVVNPDGVRLDPAGLDSLWFQCGVEYCNEVGATNHDERLDQSCDELEDWTLDDVCEIGSGDGRFEFEVPPPGPEFIEWRVEQFFGVVGIGGRSARDCWAARKAGDETLENCFFALRPVKIGPSWWLLAYAETLGMESPFPIDQIPAPLYLQPANREPTLIVSVAVEGEVVGEYPEQDTFTVAPGDHIELQLGYDEIEQYLQIYFGARELGESGTYWFEAQLENLTAQIYTTNAIHVTDEASYFSVPYDLVVDEYAEPQRSRVLFVYRDDRYGEAVATLEFDVEAKP